MKTLYSLLALFLISFTLNAQIIDIPDANFKNALVNTDCVDTNGDGSGDMDADSNDDGEISVVEAEAALNLHVPNQNITSLEGIQAFINLYSLYVDNNQLTSLDISTLNELYGITLNNNLFNTTDTIIFPINPISEYFGLFIENNLLTSITNLPSYITDLFCSDNQLTALDISALDNIYEFHCSNNPNLTSLVLSSNTGDLNLFNIGLTELDLSGLSNLSVLGCNNNPNLTSVKLNPGFIDYGSYIIENNPVLETISFKNGSNNYSSFEDSYYSICNNPNLTLVCADENEIDSWTYTIDEGGNIVTVTVDGVQQIVDNCGYTNVVVSSYCSFEPGGDYYTIEGNTKIDLDDNGCDANDAVYPNLIFTITDGTESGFFISNTSGDYSIHIGEGTQTITPVLENPSYFSVSPSNLVVDFPTDVSPYLQDFCISPNGTFNDLEITIIPLELARPGFDTNYKIVYKNKGTTTLAGDINFGFQDEVMEFVTSTPPNESGLPDLLSYSFTDLAPFESRVINLTMNLNSPMETPPLNDGDVLTFITSISSSETDETPDDNTFELHQTVVNSFDPNDKTCLEGNFITPQQVGDYVHYMIRFENTGSAEAVNIVVKDDIDRLSYDLSSLVPLDASHDYVAKIKDNASNYYVEFIFEGINLPFDDANNDGYIVFKIRTLDTLALNDTFENDAEIYFDFNFPIITNNEQTTIATLSTEDFELANNTILLYPNPTTDALHLESKQAIKHVSIYDISGRHIKEIAVIGLKTEISISTEDLSTGTYFVKIKTTQGEIVRKVIKD